MAPKLPCIDCITLAVCRASVTRFKDPNLSYLHSLLPLINRCSLLKIHVFEHVLNGDVSLEENRVFKILEFLKNPQQKST